MKIAVSYLSSKYKEKDTIKLIDNSTADYIHVDLMDGKFVENKNFTIGNVTNLLSGAKKPLDVHLMTIKPDKYFESLAMLNTEYITIHLEAVKDIEKTIDKIKSLGIKAGLSINPETSIEELTKFLPLIDQVLVMSVHPGKGGQEFILEVTTKIDELIKLREESNFSFIISVDGGINDSSIEYLKDKNIDLLVSGSYVCNSDNFTEKIESLK